VTYFYFYRAQKVCVREFPQELRFNCRSTLVTVQYKRASEYTAGMFVSTDRRSRQAIGISVWISTCYWRAELQLLEGGISTCYC